MERRRRGRGEGERRGIINSVISRVATQRTFHTLAFYRSSCSPVSYNVQNREKGHECQCLPRQTEGHLFWQSLSKSYEVLKYLRRLEDEAKMRFQYLRNGELADFFFNIKTSFSTPMMLWGKITITWSSCGVRWPLEYVRYTYLHPLDWSVKVDGSERSRLLTKNSCSR